MGFDVNTWRMAEDPVDVYAQLPLIVTSKSESARLVVVVLVVVVVVVVVAVAIFPVGGCDCHCRDGHPD